MPPIRPRDTHASAEDEHSAADHHLHGVSKIAVRRHECGHRCEADGQHHHRRRHLGVIDHRHADERQAQAALRRHNGIGRNAKHKPIMRRGASRRRGCAGRVGQTARTQHLSTVGRLVVKLDLRLRSPP